MPRRTTILLDESIYEKLVKESLTKYGTARAISKVINELLKRKIESNRDILQLICTEKVTETTAEEFERSRRKLSERLESR